MARKVAFARRVAESAKVLFIADEAPWATSEDGYPQSPQCHAETGPRAMRALIPGRYGRLALVATRTPRGKVGLLAGPVSGPVRLQSDAPVSNF